MSNIVLSSSQLRNALSESSARLVFALVLPLTAASLVACGDSSNSSGPGDTSAQTSPATPSTGMPANPTGQQAAPASPTEGAAAPGEMPARGDLPLAPNDPSNPAVVTGSAMPTGEPTLPVVPTGTGLGPREPNSGPGGPRVAFQPADLFKVCAPIDGDATDLDHHNTVAMYDGYMVLPFAHEAGGGGVSFYDVSNPCTPRRVGSGLSPEMRETHTVSISNINGRWLFAAQKERNLPTGGMQVWDISDISQPSVVAKLPIQGHSYPNAYDFVTMATAPQGKYLYVAAGFLGFFIVDISEPRTPRIVSNYKPTPPLRAQEVIVVGNLLFSSAAEGARVLLLDISDPTSPQPIPGGDFLLQAGNGVQSNAYAANLNGGYAYFARQSGTGGLIVYDIRNPEQPRRAGEFNDAGGNGGYSFFHGSNVFVGNSSSYAIYDASDLTNIKSIARLNLQGDQDTITPIGNIVLLSVDADAQADRASAIAPWQTEVDTTPPSVNWVYPPSGATGLALTSRIGVTFNEGVDYKSAWRSGAVRMYPTDIGPSASVDADVSVMDTVVNLVPKAVLAPQTKYTFEVVAGGVEDNLGNPVDKTFTATFTTGG